MEQLSLNAPAGPSIQHAHAGCNLAPANVLSDGSLDCVCMYLGVAVRGVLAGGEEEVKLKFGNGGLWLLPSATAAVGHEYGTSKEWDSRLAVGGLAGEVLASQC